MTLEVGDRVYYKNNGPTDTGTVVETISPKTTLDPYHVRWDHRGGKNDPESDWYPEEALVVVEPDPMDW